LLHALLDTCLPDVISFLRINSPENTIEAHITLRA
jgi:hypothetical protein